MEFYFIGVINQKEHYTNLARTRMNVSQISEVGPQCISINYNREERINNHRHSDRQRGKDKNGAINLHLFLLPNNVHSIIREHVKGEKSKLLSLTYSKQKYFSLYYAYIPADAASN